MESKDHGQQQRKTEAEQALARKDQYLAVSDLEVVNVHQDPAQLEDVTAMVFQAIDSLKDCQLLCRDDFDMNETMSAFEVMDQKMDVRMGRNSSMIPQKAIAQGLLIIDRPLNNQELVALLDEFLIMFASWQQSNAQIQQSLYSCQYLIKREYYSKNPLLIYYFEALHYIIFTYFSSARLSAVIREEDVQLPPIIKRHHQGEIWEILEKLNQQIDELQKKKLEIEEEIILGHLKLIKQLVLLLINSFDKEAMEVLNKDEEVVSKKKKKNKKKVVDLSEIVKNTFQAIEILRKSENLPLTTEREWASLLFDESILANLPFVSNRRKYSKLSLPQSHQFFEGFMQEISKLVDVCPGIQYYEDLQLLMDHFLVMIPCPMLKTIFEREIFSEVPQSLFVFGQEIKTFLKKGIGEQHPFIINYFESPTFNEFLYKYSIVTKELLINNLRSKARQRRCLSKVFEDLSIVLNEGNFADEKLLSNLHQNVKKNNTVGIALTVNMSVQCQINYLMKGFELDLYSLHELPMIFNYIRQSYQMMLNNRKQMISNLCENLVKSNLVDFQDLNKSGAKFKQFRKRATPLKKIIFDHYEFCKGMLMIYGGMTRIALASLRWGAIDNILAKEGVEKQVYENRFKPFKSLFFPKYIDYEQYVEMTTIDAETLAQEMEQAKLMFNEGTIALTNLIQTEEAMRNVEHLSKDYLEKLKRLTVTNSLMTTKIAMFGDKALLKINKENSLRDLLAFDVEKKP